VSYCILSFCGGGIRGTLSAGYLSRLYAQFPDVVKNTHLLAGTSTGADIISLLMADMTPDKVYDVYMNKAPAEFENMNPLSTMPGYDTEKLVRSQRMLHLLDRKLNDHKKHSILFTSFNVGSSADNPWKTLLYTNLPVNNNGDVRIVDAVVSSSLMPGMYGSLGGNVDGAFVNHDPTVAAIALAVSNGHALDDIACICFGTGYMPNWIASDTSNWGALQWQQGDGNPASQLPPLLINGTSSPVLNMMMNGTSTNLMPQLSQMLLGDRYVYINSTLDKIVPENDINPADLKYMQTLVADEDIAPALTLLESHWK